MEKWLGVALDYIPRWVEHQMRLSEQPGCVVAVADKGRIILERAWGHADLARNVALTPRYRFRVASHSKSFTSAGIMQAAREPQTEPRRPGWPICFRAASGGREGDDRAIAIAQRWHHSRRRG